MGMGFNPAVELLYTAACTVVQLLYLEKKKCFVVWSSFVTEEGR